MPALTVTYPTLSNPADKAEIEANFNATEAVVNNLDNSNIAATAGIANSKLDANDYEFVMNLEVKPTTAVAPGVSATIPIAVCGLPGTTTDGAAYTVLSGTWYITDDGTLAGTTTFNVELGYGGAGPNWTQVGADIVSATSITGSGENQQSGALAINTSAITLHASTQYFLALFLTVIDATALNTAYSHLDITLKLRRTDGLR